ncbi:DNA oxidative demethylase ALKBH2-like isoform X2 [Lineus longissimus]|uniref:DNA oxidative demethylase ALKBH2-like isoform X2 n=1 Tax=Lineus longissimus TaxID=88925 RepID=UPI00315D2459
MDKFLTRSSRKRPGEEYQSKDKLAVSKLTRTGHSSEKIKEEGEIEASLNSSDFVTKIKAELSPKTERSTTCTDTVKCPGEHEEALALSVKKEDPLSWRKIKAENLDLDYCKLYGQRQADKLFIRCEKELEYNTGQLGKVAHGERGLNYTFSGNTIPARPWTPLLLDIKDRISRVTGHEYNFVLINRYNDGKDHMGEHRDDEKDLVKTAPIASLTLGQSRDFIFKHCEARGKNAERKIDPVKVVLEHGCLLMMNHPTNTYWYHALPVRKGVKNVRINMTFRKMAID